MSQFDMRQPFYLVYFVQFILLFYEYLLLLMVTLRFLNLTPSRFFGFVVDE